MILPISGSVQPAVLVASHIQVVRQTVRKGKYNVKKWWIKHKTRYKWKYISDWTHLHCKRMHNKLSQKYTRKCSLHIEGACVLAKQHHPVSLFVQFTQQLVQYLHLATRCVVCMYDEMKCSIYKKSVVIHAKYIKWIVTILQLMSWTYNQQLQHKIRPYIKYYVTSSNK